MKLALPPLPLLLAAALLPLSAPAGAQILKCVGPKGVEFAARCPPGTKAMDTGISNKPSSNTASPQKSLAEREAEFRKRKLSESEKEKKSASAAKEAADRELNCISAKGSLASLESGERIARRDPKTGERAFLGDSERAAEIERARRAVETNCK